MLTYSVSAGKTFSPGELVDNTKLNQLGLPSVTPAGGLEWAQTRLDGWFGGTNGGAVNAYTLQMVNANQDRTGTMPDGMVVVIRPTITNTAASTLALKDSSGTIIVAASAIKRRFNLALYAGDLVAGASYMLMWDLANTVWQLVSPWGGIGTASDIGPDQYFYGASSGTGTAYSLSYAGPAPAPTVLKAAMIVIFSAPADNTNATTTLNVASLGAKPLRKWSNAVLEPGDLVTGMKVIALYDEGADAWMVMNPTVNAKVLTVGTPANAQNLVVTRIGVTQVTITADQIVVQNSSKQGHLLSAVSVSPAITTAGANGLDTGAEGASTWYYVWVIWNSATNVAAGLFSTSSTAPTMPSGYDFKALVSVVRNDGSSNFVDYWQSGRKVWTAEAVIFTGKTATAADTYQILAGADLTAFQAAVPPIAKSARGLAGSSDAANVPVMEVAADSGGLGVSAAIGGIVGSVWNGFSGCSPFEVPLRTSQNLYWKSFDNTVARNRLTVTGYDI